MTYDEIKRELHEAAQMVDAGNVAGADVKIRAMLGKGLTGADLDANLSREQMRLLRSHSKAAKVTKGVMAAPAAIWNSLTPTQREALEELTAATNGNKTREVLGASTSDIARLRKLGLLRKREASRSYAATDLGRAVRATADERKGSR